MTEIVAFVNDLRIDQLLDLSHVFHPGIPHAPGMPEEQTRLFHNYETDGFQSHFYQFSGQWGTHIDPPIHMSETGRTLPEITLKELFLPLIVFDCTAECTKDPDYTISIEKIHDWESRHGTVPSKCMAVMKTGWANRWPSVERLFNMDEHGIAHYPGWSLEVLRYLISDRSVTAIGHETTDTDCGIATTRDDDFSCEQYVLDQGIYQIELLANLSAVPESGAAVFVGFPKPHGGSGFPARVIAIVP